MKIRTENGNALKELESLTAKQKEALIKLLKVDVTHSIGYEAIQPREIGDRIPLSFGQERLWFLSELENSNLHYNLCIPLEIDGAIDRDALVTSLEYIMDRHEVLRTHYVSNDGIPEQVIGAEHCITVITENVSSFDQVKTICHIEANTEFDLQDRLIKVKLLFVSPVRNYLVVTVHHSVFDGWSSGILVRELVSLYGQICNHQTPKLSPLPIQYADYAIWQRKYLTGEVLEKQLDYWKGKLVGLNPLMKLPYDRARPAVKTYNGSLVKFELPLATLHKLNKLSVHNDVTLFMTLLSVFKLLLWRYSNESSIAVGAPIANRNRPETENLIGFFVNTLVMKTELQDKMRFLDLLSSVRTTALEAYAHQDIPFERLVESLQPKRSMSFSPFFQVMMVLQNIPDIEPGIDGVVFTALELDYIRSKFDLTLFLNENNNGLSCSFEYNTDLFDTCTVQRFGIHFQNLVDQVLANPELGISSFDFLGKEEKNRVLIDWNATAVEYPTDRCLHDLFVDQVLATPDNIAVLDAAGELSYQELYQQSIRVAHYLLQSGVAPNELVGVVIGKSCPQIVAVMGILFSGAAYLPVDVTWPSQRQNAVLTAGKCRLVISSNTLSSASQWSDGLEILHIEDLMQLEIDPSTLQPLPSVAETDLAYVIFTSGSTGEPKGVMIEHGSAVNTLQDINARFDIKSKDSILALSSLAFDLSVYDIFGLLAVGGCVVLPLDDDKVNPSAWLQLLVEHGITLWNTVPGVFQMLVDFMELEKGSDNVGTKVPELRLALLSGDWLPVELPRRASTLMSKLDMISLGGATEASIWSNYYPIEDVEINRASIPYGKPLGNQRFYILDEKLQPCPIGVAGYLYIAGVGLARGYWENQELTAASFIEHEILGERLYKTGDLGRWFADGNIEFLGRRDGQVKIRGFRIELGEIESRLSRHDAVQACVVLVREDKPGDRRLVAYVVAVATEGEEVADFQSSMREYLQQMLPDYMVPGAFVLLEDLPMTANGKIDRQALPIPDSNAYSAEQYVAPQSGTEKILAGIWAELLQLASDEISVTANFFELGGHSLLVMRLNARLQEYDLYTDIRSVLNAPSLADLAAAIDGGSDSAVPMFAAPPNLIPVACQQITPEMLPLIRLSPDEIARIVASVPGGTSNIQDIYPLAPLQEGILFHHLVDQEHDPYVLPNLFSIDSSGQLDAFVEALQTVVDRHDVLRTAILTEDLSMPVQVVYRTAELTTEQFILDPEAETMPQLQSMLTNTPAMDLTRAPALQLMKARDPHSSQWYVLLLIHHVITDHIGLEIIMKEGLGVLMGLGTQLPAPEPYREFVAHSLHQAQTQDAEAYFRERLGDITEPTAPFNLLNVHGDGSLIEEARQTLPPELAKAIRACAQSLHVSPATLFHAAWAVVVANCSGRDDVVFGTVLSGRLQGTRGAESMLGMFINTLPLRITLSGKSVKELVISTDKALNELLEYEQASLAVAQRCSGVDSNSILYSAMLNYRHSTPVERSNSESTVDIGITSISGKERTNYPFLLSVTDLGDDFSIVAQIEKSVNAKRIICYVERAISEIAKSLDGAYNNPSLSLSILPDSERNRLVHDWNETDRSFGKSYCIHELFEAQAKTTPDSIAVSYNGEKITYNELNERSNQLARYLIDEGVSPDTLVGLCVERSFEMVIGIFGILKAGGAYMPIEPDYPPDRIRYMLEDSEVKTILTQSHLESRIPHAHRHLVFLDTKSDIRGNIQIFSEYKTANINKTETGLTSNHLAYVIYTSGSTGKPKGVMVEHTALVNRIEWMQNNYPIDDSDVVLQKTPFSFDVSVWELTWPFITGAQLVMAMPGGHKDLDYLVSVIQQSEVSTLHFVPSVFRLILAHDDWGSCCSIKRVFCSGEALPADLPSLHYDLNNAELYNLYGPTEAAIDVSSWHCARNSQPKSIPIGRPIQNIQLYVLNQHGQLQPQGAEGELYIGGAGLARGYLNNSELTAKQFIHHPFSDDSDDRLYKTGDLVRWLADGNLEYIGRIDHQVKIRGFRIELGEIETCLSQHDNVNACVVVAREDSPGEKRLVAYVVLDNEEGGSDADDYPGVLRDHLLQSLPDYMVPAAYVSLDSIPLTSNGKVDRKALPLPNSDAFGHDQYVAPQTGIEETLLLIWADLLHFEPEKIGVTTNFFELGGHSLLTIRLKNEIKRSLGIEIPITDIFAYPTLRSLANRLRNTGQEAEEVPVRLSADRTDRAAQSGAIAIIGLAGRFPDAKSPDEFWENISQGVESLRVYSDEQLREAGIDAALFGRSDYIRSGAPLDNFETFDADYFQLTPREAEMTCPQHRLLLECAVEALEHGGYGVQLNGERVGVFVGASNSAYLLKHLAPRSDIFRSMGEASILQSSAAEFIATRLSYKLNLTGPSINLNTACSTSLVAITQAGKYLLDFDCDLALAGGASIRKFIAGGILYQEGSIFSSDGHCRPFDIGAQGTRAGDGAGMVLLKRFEDAVADGDTIHAVIKGSAVNNDGSFKVGYTAPSVLKQTSVIREAMIRAGVTPDTLQYVEAHGTATHLGDPIEIAALNLAFDCRNSLPDMLNTCAIGAVKANIGHLDAAAGIAGLIKTVLALKHRQLPPAINFTETNSEIAFGEGPFYVNTELKEWPREATPRRAGVSSFGIGGTNAHVILEEAPIAEAGSSSRKTQLLLLSARTASALSTACKNAAAHLTTAGSGSLADMAYTLKVGRKTYDHRRFLVCDSPAEAARTLKEEPDSGVSIPDMPQVVFMFPELETAYPGMAEDLYHEEPLFKKTVDQCAEMVIRELGTDVRDLLYPPKGDTTLIEESEKRLAAPLYGQVALFIVQYALACLWLSWKVKPDAMTGLGSGQCVSACLSGVFTLETALNIVIAKARTEQIDDAQNCDSPRSDPPVSGYSQLLAKLTFNVPEIPLLTSVGGKQLTESEATDPNYWIAHLGNPEHHPAVTDTLSGEVNGVCLVIGPGLSSPETSVPAPGQQRIIASMGAKGSHQTDATALATALGYLWQQGVEISWPEYHQHDTCHRIPLPTYPFERKRYWIDRDTGNPGAILEQSGRADPQEGQIHIPGWKRLAFPVAPWEMKLSAQKLIWLVFAEETGVGDELVQHLQSSGQTVVCVRTGTSFSHSDNDYVIDPQKEEDYSNLIASLWGTHRWPDKVVHLWSRAKKAGKNVTTLHGFEKTQQRGFYSLLYLVKALVAKPFEGDLSLDVVTERVCNISGEGKLIPANGTLAGLCKVISQEHSKLKCHLIDMDSGIVAKSGKTGNDMTKQLVAELCSEDRFGSVALRGAHRWVQHYEKIHPNDRGQAIDSIKPEGTYIITGGLGKIGLILAGHLLRQYQANVVLVGRTKIPGEKDWEKSLEKPGDPIVDQKIRRLLELQKMGGNVLTCQADVGIHDDMESVFKQTEKAFGKIDGVIHGAGDLSDHRATIEDMTDISYQNQYRTKVTGLLVLEKVLNKREVDFCLLMSSLSSVLGGLGFASYAAVNYYMDVFVQNKHNQGERHWRSVNWDGWHDSARAGADMRGTAFTAEQGCEVFQQILSLPDTPQVVASLGNLEERLKKWVEMEDRPARGNALYARPEIGKEYVEPATETEVKLAGIWQDLLGIEQIGTRDNFFELGGESLLATRVMSAIRDAFHSDGVEFSLRFFFENPTIEAIATALEEKSLFTGLDNTRKKLEKSTLTIEEGEIV